MPTQIQRERERHGLGRIHLAVRAKVSERTIYNLETLPKEKCRATRKTSQARIAKALGVATVDLFTLDGRARA